MPLIKSALGSGGAHPAALETGASAGLYPMTQPDTHSGWCLGLALSLPQVRPRGVQERANVGQHRPSRHMMGTWGEGVCRTSRARHFLNVYLF